MTLTEMRYALGTLLDGNKEQRYDVLDKVRRLNLAQQQLVAELVSGLPPDRTSFLPLPVETITFNPESSPTDRFTLPQDFVFPISITAEDVDPVFLHPGTPLKYPYKGTNLQPVIRQEGEWAVWYGRKHNISVDFSYYRMPQEMKYEDYATLSGETHTEENKDCELPATYHERIVRIAYNLAMATNEHVPTT